MASHYSINLFQYFTGPYLSVSCGLHLILCINKMDLLRSAQEDSEIFGLLKINSKQSFIFLLYGCTTFSIKALGWIGLTFMPYRLCTNYERIDSANMHLEKPYSWSFLSEWAVSSVAIDFSTPVLWSQYVWAIFKWLVTCTKLRSRATLLCVCLAWQMR